MRSIDLIVVHCTATPQGRAVTVADIDRWHRQKGWNGIGYHHVVYADGSLHAGRPEEQPGAHCLGHNAHSIGICYVGGLDAGGHPADTRTPAQRRTLERLVRGLLSRYPGARVAGHSELAAKDCPCFDVQAWLRSAAII